MTKMYLLTLQGPHSFFFSWRSNSVSFKQSLFCSIKIFLNIEMQMLFMCIIISFLSLETIQVLKAAETGGTLSKWQPKAKSEISESVLHSGWDTSISYEIKILSSLDSELRSLNTPTKDESLSRCWVATTKSKSISHILNECPYKTGNRMKGISNYFQS